MSAVVNRCDFINWAGSISYSILYGINCKVSNSLSFNDFYLQGKYGHVAAKKQPYIPVCDTDKICDKKENVTINKINDNSCNDIKCIDAVLIK